MDMNRCVSVNVANAKVTLNLTGECSVLHDHTEMS